MYITYIRTHVLHIGGQLRPMHLHFPARLFWARTLDPKRFTDAFKGPPFPTQCIKGPPWREEAPRNRDCPNRRRYFTLERCSQPKASGGFVPPPALGTPLIRNDKHGLSPWRHACIAIACDGVYMYIYIYIGPPQAFQHRLHGYYICNITRLMQMHICARVRVHMRMHAHAHMHGTCDYIIILL